MATTRKRTAKAAMVDDGAEVISTPVVEEKAVKAKPQRAFDNHEYVTVRNGFQGKLIYKSRHTGELFIWEEFGDELELELKELKDAKVSNKKLFINNYFVIDDKEVLKHLGMAKFYTHALPIDEFDEIFDESPERLKEIIATLPEGQRSSLAYRARILIAHDAIDSNKTIKALEEALGTELVARD